MQLRKHLSLLALIAFVACKKEVEVPVTPQPINASFTLVSSGGNCSDISVQGSFMAGISLNSNNKLVVRVNALTTGLYTAFTSPVNGISFSGSGNFTSTGIQFITLYGNGTPNVAGAVSPSITINGSSCSFSIIIGGTTTNTVLNDNDHMLFGNPSNAAPIVDSFANYLMRKPYYSTSYNRDRGIPNWVSWHLFIDDLGSAPRQDDFRPDLSLPTGWYQVSDVSYSGSGFDRGHNVASADRTSTTAANSSTFLMTNIIPQAPLQNQDVWAKFEDSLRRLVNLGSEVYIIMGNYGSGGIGNNGVQQTIDGGRVTVPSNIWKVALVLPNGNNDSSRVNESTRLIAVNIPNINSASSNWKNYRISIDALESITGYDFLNRLPLSLQAAIEARVDNL